MERNFSYSFERGEKLTFSSYDYVVWGLTLVISAAIGLYYAIVDRKKNDTEEFLLGGRKLQILPVSLSLLSSFISAITILGTPAEIYLYDTMFWWISVGFIISAIGAAHIFIPVFHRLKITSTFEYVERRFGKLVRTISSVIYLIWMFLFMAIVLYGPSLALHAVTGLDLWGSVVAVGLVCTFYTTLGGMKAVVWTDSLQLIIMFAGMFTLLIVGSNKVGGLAEVWRIAYENGRIRFFDFNPDPTVRHTVWTVCIGGGMLWGAIYGINQAQVQRAISLPTVRKMQIAVWLNFPGFVLIQTLACSVGLVMFAYFHTCDPAKLGKKLTREAQHFTWAQNFKIPIDSVEEYDGTCAKRENVELIPLFTMDLVGHIPGLPGLVMSCVFSGSLSTISSGLNAIAAVILKDCIKACCWKNPSPFKEAIVSKIIVVFEGVLCLLLAYVVSELGAILEISYLLFGILGGPILGLFTLGMLFPWANKWGALVGHLTALVLLLWIVFGAKVEGVVAAEKSTLTIDGCRVNMTSMVTTLNPNITTTPINVSTSVKSDLAIYKMSYMWQTGLATLTTVVIGLIVSFITGYTRPETLDSRLICPIFDELFPYLPEKVRKPLRFGVDHGKVVSEDKELTDIYNKQNK